MAEVDSIIALSVGDLEKRLGNSKLQPFIKTSEESFVSQIEKIKDILFLIKK